jgi:hypothetical protein
MTGISRAFMSVLATSILITPVVILEFVSGNVARLIIIVLAAGAFVLVISLLAKARTVEVLAAGAALVRNEISARVVADYFVVMPLS